LQSLHKTGLRKKLKSEVAAQHQSSIPNAIWEIKERRNLYTKIKTLSRKRTLSLSKFKYSAASESNWHTMTIVFVFFELTRHCFEISREGSD
jgi:hypothetical protein